MTAAHVTSVTAAMAVSESNRWQNRNRQGT
jgi:hypothetical protein